MDVGLDVGSNVGIDVGLDVGIDIGLDVGIDVGLDVGIDVGLDVGIDVGLEVGIDVGLDVSIEVRDERRHTRADPALTTTWDGRRRIATRRPRSGPTRPCAGRRQNLSPLRRLLSALAGTTICAATTFDGCID